MLASSSAAGKADIWYRGGMLPLGTLGCCEVGFLSVGQRDPVDERLANLWRCRRARSPPSLSAGGRLVPGDRATGADGQSFRAGR